MKTRYFLILTILSLFTLQALAQDVSIKVLKFTNATAKDKTRVYEALRLIGKVINTTDFRNQILDMEYKVTDNGETLSGYTQTTLSSQEVLESIIRAMENFPGGTLGVIHLNMNMYYECTPFKCPIGSTSPSDPFFHMNRYFHNNFSPAQAAGNIFHEWLHKLGHQHSSKSNPERPHSVPYKLGYLVAKMTAQIAADEDPVRAQLFEEEFKNMLEQPCDH